MKNSELLSFIQDDELRLIAKNANLIEWEWGTNSDIQKLAMIEGAAVMLQEFLDNKPSFHTGKEGQKVLLWKMLQVNIKENLDDCDDYEREVTWAYFEEAIDEPVKVYKIPKYPNTIG